MSLTWPFKLYMIYALILSSVKGSKYQNPDNSKGSFLKPGEFNKHQRQPFIVPDYAKVALPYCSKINPDNFADVVDSDHYSLKQVQVVLR